MSQPPYGEPFQPPQQPSNPPPYPDPTQGQPEYPPAYGQPQGPPYGQPAYGQPAYGQPAYGQPESPPAYDPYAQPQSAPPFGQTPYGQPYAAVAAPKKTNGFAIASLIFGIFGGLLFSVIFGIVALSQIKKRGDGGRGMAIAGLVLSGVWVLVICVGVAAAIIFSDKTDPGSTPQTRPSKETTIQLEDLKVGDCVNGLKESDSLARLPVINCASPHQGEIVGEYRVSGSTYPGETKIQEEAETKCFDLLDAYSPSTADDQSIEVFYIYPTTSSWRQGDRQVLCIAEHTAGDKTGSIKG